MHLPMNAATMAALALCALVAVIAFAASNASADTDHAGTGASTRFTIALGLAGYSPVSYIQNQRAEPGSPEFSAEHEGVTYFFTSAQQRDTFTSNPEPFLPAYGGYCAFGCSVDSHFVPDPHSFKIVDGRLHLFLKNDEVDARSLWDKETQSEVQRKADAFWAGQSND